MSIVNFWEWLVADHLINVAVICIAVPCLIKLVSILEMLNKD